MFGQLVRFWWLWILLAIVGCGESRKPVYPVKGKLVNNGKPLAGVWLFLHALNHEEGNPLIPKAQTEADGSFVVSSYGNGDGAPAGEYIITLSGGSGSSENEAPYPAYLRDAETSRLRIVVQEQATDLGVIDVISK